MKKVLKSLNDNALATKRSNEKLSNLQKDDVRIMVPAKKYQICDDERLLIPFISNRDGTIGFVNRDAEVVVKPRYNIVLDDCYNENDFIRVGRLYTYKYSNSKTIYKKYKYGVIDFSGNKILKCEYGSILIFDKTFLIEHVFGPEVNYSRSIVDHKGNPIVPFEKYLFNLDHFPRRLSRVRLIDEDENEGHKYGIMNENGEIIAPIIYDEIGDYYDRRASGLTLKRGKNVEFIKFSDVFDMKKREADIISYFKTMQ